MLLLLPLAFNQATASHQIDSTPLPCSKLLHGLLQVRGQGPILQLLPQLWIIGYQRQCRRMHAAVKQGR